VRDVRPLATAERERLVVFLRSLTPDEWVAPTAAPGWRVKDLALHLLDGDLGWLSRNRDGDGTSFVDMSDRSAFVELLAAKNQAWLAGARGLSRQLVTDLLIWSGQQLDVYEAQQDLLAEGWVSWASDRAVPYWFNLAQEFTERWVHQQQMREAVDRIESHEELLPQVLHTFIWAYPHQFRLAADARSEVEITITEIGTWTLTSQANGRWDLTNRPADPAPLARLTLTANAAWRMFTGAAVPANEVQTTGPQHLSDALIQVRGIIV
jgi:hypothetical protein